LKKINEQLIEENKRLKKENYPQMYGGTPLFLPRVKRKPDIQLKSQLEFYEESFRPVVNQAM
jgi:hypothetical protein